MKVARNDPHVRAAHAAQMARVERAIAEGLAARIGADGGNRPLSVGGGRRGRRRDARLRRVLGGSGGTGHLGQLIDQAFRALADGLPEHSALRDMTSGKDQN